MMLESTGRSSRQRCLKLERLSKNSMNNGDDNTRKQYNNYKISSISGLLSSSLLFTMRTLTIIIVITNIIIMMCSLHLHHHYDCFIFVVGDSSSSTSLSSSISLKTTTMIEEGQHFLRSSTSSTRNFFQQQQRFEESHQHTFNSSSTTIDSEEKLPFVSKKRRRQRTRRRNLVDDTTTFRKFTYMDSKDIYDHIHMLAKEYPNFVTLTSSQRLYNLPRAGGTLDCPFESDVIGCSNWILTIEDKLRHNASDINDNDELPEILLSGCLHGDERVGPTVVVETATLLIEAASCEASLQSSSQLYNDTIRGGKDDIYPECIQNLWNNWDIPVNDTNNIRRWLSRLVSTRRIVVVPTTNSLGYYRNERTEDGIDPNRDFPYDLIDPSYPSGNEYTKCMQTIAGRTINELFRSHIFYQSFTFHGGIEMIGYEWGSPSHIVDKISPDHIAENLLSSKYSSYGGSFFNNYNNAGSGFGFSGTSGSNSGGGDFYIYGDMNSILYPVRGGMEDWAYAASWDVSLTQPCSPITYNGYPSEQTRYDNGTLRTLNMLVETSMQKIPSDDTLGTTENLLTLTNYSNTVGNGHVSRNIRLALLLIEMVQPYIQIIKLNNTKLEEDVIPATTLYNTFETCTSINTTARTIRVFPPSPSAASSTISNDEDDPNAGMNNYDEVSKHEESNDINSWTIPLEWTIGGSFNVDETSLIYGTYNDMKQILPDTFCLTPPTHEQWDKILQSIQEPNSSIQYAITQAGKPTKWSNITNNSTNSNNVNDDDNDDDNDDTTFNYHATIDLSSIMEKQQEQTDNDNSSGDSSSNIIITAIKKREEEDNNDNGQLRQRHERSLEDETTKDINENNTIVAFVVAIVDTSWGDNSMGVEVSPQSHMVNARTNTSWYYKQSTSQKLIQGRYVWFSLPITIHIDDMPPKNNASRTVKNVINDKNDIASSATTGATTTLTNDNFDPVEGPNLSFDKDKPTSSTTSSGSTIRNRPLLQSSFILIMLISVIAFLLGLVTL